MRFVEVKWLARPAITEASGGWIGGLPLSDPDSAPVVDPNCMASVAYHEGRWLPVSGAHERPFSVTPWRRAKNLRDFFNRHSRAEPLEIGVSDAQTWAVAKNASRYHSCKDQHHQHENYYSPAV